MCNNLFANRKDVEIHVVTEHGSESLDCHDDKSSVDAGDSDLDSDNDRFRNQKRHIRRGSILKPCPNVFKKEWKYRRQFYTENIFPSLCVTLAEWATEVDRLSYLPSTKFSAKFTVDNTNLNKSDQLILERLHGFVTASSSILFG